MRLYCTLFFLSLGFFVVHCEKETQIVPVEKMDSFNPEYDWQPLLIPQGIESSPDSMAQVIHGYFKLANSLEDHIRFCYFPPFELDAHAIKRTPKEGFNTWTVSFQRQGIEIYDVSVVVNLKVHETETEYLWEANTYFNVPLPISGVEDFNLLYIESGATKDFKAGYMRKVFIWDYRVHHCGWEWEVNGNSTYNMSVTLNDLSSVKPDWPLPENTPGRAEIVLKASCSGEMKFYKIKDQKFILHFKAQWDSLGSGQYQIYNQDGSQIIRQGTW